MSGVLTHTDRGQGNNGAVATAKAKVLQVATSGITFKALLSPLVDRLEHEGYEVHITCSDGSYTQELIEKGYRYTPIRIERKISPLSNLKSLWNLYHLIRREKFDVVHVHTPIAAVVGRIAAKMARTPIIIYTAHGFYFHDRMSPRVRNAIVWLEKTLGRMTDMLMTQSSEDAKTAVDEDICPSNKVRWIGNGVDVQAFHFSTSGIARWPGLSETDRVVGFVGRMVSEKGIVELIDAMDIVAKAVPDAKLMLVGDTLDDDRDRGVKDVIREKIESYGLESKVVFTGFVNDVPGVMSMMDLFVLPSHREGMPRSIIEAMASGKPVVATDIRGCREEVVDGITGRLVPVNDALALAEAIIEILSDTQKGIDMGVAGRNRAEELFDENMVLGREVEVYRQLLAARLKGKA